MAKNDDKPADPGVIDTVNVPDESDQPHEVEFGESDPPEKGPDLSAREAAQRADAKHRAERLAPVIRDAELRHAVNPITGGEVSTELEQAIATLRIPVMKPESRGDMADITWPGHVQAPPVEQVAPEALTKRNSSTRQREEAARRNAPTT